MECITASCSQPVWIKKRGLCRVCYRVWTKSRSKNGQCSVDGCERPIYIKKHGLCRTCYSHFYRHGVAPPTPGLDKTQHISIAQAAQILGCSSRKLRKMKECGQVQQGPLTMADVQELRERWSIVRRSDVEHQSRTISPQAVECEQCGEWFHRKPTRVKGFWSDGKWRGPTKYCSRQCVADAKRKPRIKVIRCKPEPELRRAGPFIVSSTDTYLESEWQAECDVCGDRFHPFTRKGRYCGPHCRHLATKDTGGSPWLRHRTAVIERDGLTCHLCGEAIDLDLPVNHHMDLTIDHVIPRAAGGTDDLDNLRPAHRSCNSAKGARTDFVAVGDRPIYPA